MHHKNILKYYLTTIFLFSTLIFFTNQDKEKKNSQALNNQKTQTLAHSLSIKPDNSVVNNSASIYEESGKVSLDKTKHIPNGNNFHALISSQKNIFSDKEDREQLKMRLSDLLNEYYQDIDSVLDQELSDYLKDESIHRVEKLNVLWEIAQQFPIGSEEYTYILTRLESTEPIELMDKLVVDYKTTDELSEKLSLLKLMKASVEDYEYFGSIDELAPAEQRQLALINEKKQVLYDLIISEPLYSNNEEVFKESVLSYSSVAAPEEFVSTMSEMILQNSDRESYKKVINVALQTIFHKEDSPAQTTLTQLFIDAVDQQFPEEVRQVFDNQVHKILDEDEYDLTEETARVLSQYL